MAVATNIGVSPRATSGPRLDVARLRSARLRSARRSVPGGVLTFLVVLGIGWASGGNGPAVPAQVQVAQVRQGDTLWSMAGRLDPAESAATVVARIRQLNGLDVDSTVYPGELLRVPSTLSGAAAAKAGVLQR